MKKQTWFLMYFSEEAQMRLGMGPLSATRLESHLEKSLGVVAGIAVSHTNIQSLFQVQFFEARALEALDAMKNVQGSRCEALHVITRPRVSGHPFTEIEMTSTFSSALTVEYQILDALVEGVPTRRLVAHYEKGKHVAFPLPVEWPQEPTLVTA